MKKYLLSIKALCLSGILLFSGTTMKAENPFFGEYNTPYNIPPFEKIQIADYMPAFEEAIAQHNQEIAAIVNNRAVPDFENTIVALDNSGEMLEKVSYVFSGLYEVVSTPEFQKVGAQVFPMLAAHSDEIKMNEGLFQKIKSVYDNRAKFNLTTPQLRLLEKYYKDFARNGALLSEEKKAELKDINDQLSKLCLQFGDNILKDTNKWTLVVDNEKDLAGLPASSIAVAAEEAKAMGKEGKWVFTLHAPSRLPFLTYADNRDLREKMYKAYTNIANNNDENDNKAIINQILKLRLQKAKLFGFDSFAAYQMDNVMAKTVEDAEELLYKVWKPAVAKAHEEIADMQKYVDNHGGNFKIAAWDYYYYAEKVKKEKFNFDENDVRAYFPIENVRKGIFTMAERLYGITFKEVNNVPVYHPDVKVYEVLDKDGKHLSMFMTDYYARGGKRQGAWMFVYQEANGTKDVRPIGYNGGNLSNRTAFAPS